MNVNIIEDEEKAIETAIKDGKVIVIHGARGSGKTRLCNAMLCDELDENINRVHASELGKYFNSFLEVEVLIIEDLETSGRLKKSKAIMAAQLRELKKLQSDKNMLIHAQFKPERAVKTPRLIIIETDVLPEYARENCRFHIIEVPGELERV